MGLTIRLLGKPEAIVDGGTVDLGPPRQRVTLAVLLLANNMTASVSTVVGGVWDDAPPVRYRNVVATHISRLRVPAAGQAGPEYTSGAHSKAHATGKITQLGPSAQSNMLRWRT